MRKQWAKKHTILLIAVIGSCFIIYGISYWNIIKPLNTELDRLEQEVSMFETQYNRLTSTGGEDTLTGELEEVATLVPMQKSPDNILVVLRQLAESSDINLTYIGELGNQNETEDDGERENLQSHDYTLDASAGDLAAINTFLGEIQQSERFMIIDTMYISQTEDAVDLSVTFRAFSAS
ncbi:hypothetical protein [Oceanobacillus halotolerans]|uniref:hypothetical protein n=1 Tax=Oceanobacillus halotolerans TaxID=2663380 RepID=UPI0013DB4684|nr:hypothetical protein [Oceanobacillus halotolerans]